MVVDPAAESPGLVADWSPAGVSFARSLNEPRPFGMEACPALDARSLGRTQTVCQWGGSYQSVAEVDSRGGSPPPVGGRLR